MPERHIRAAELLSGQPIDHPSAEAPPQALIDLMKAVGAPSGLIALGYPEADIPAIVEGALKQQRLLTGARKPVGGAVLCDILRQSLRNW